MEASPIYIKIVIPPTKEKHSDVKWPMLGIWPYAHRFAEDRAKASTVSTGNYTQIDNTVWSFLKGQSRSQTPVAREKQEPNASVFGHHTCLTQL